MEKNIPVSQRETYTPSRFTELLWWLSTAEKEILIDSVIDRNRYRIIGMTVMATWLFATLAWTYFFSTVTPVFAVAIPLGIFMGMIILIIDRALIKGITKNNRTKAGPLIFRGFLALTIGAFMAQPAVLYLFDMEIKMQTSLDNENRKLVKRASLDSLFNNRKHELQSHLDKVDEERNRGLIAVSAARNNFLAESDGSGGTGKIGIKNIALAKRHEYQKLDAEYQAYLAESKPYRDSVSAALNSIEAEKKQEEKLFAAALSDGFLTKVEALNNLLKDHPALQYRYWLIVVILVLIELLPVIAKSMLPSGSYDEKARLREQLEIDMALLNTEREKQLKQLYNELAFKYDTESIEALFNLTADQRKEKITNLGQEWKKEGKSFDNLWAKIKKEVLTKQEN